MRKNYITSILLLTTLFLIFTLGCKRENVLENVIPSVPVATPTSNPIIVNDLIQVTASVSGIVLDESNAPIASAIVTSGTVTTTTNSNGMFIFQNISLSKENGSVTVVKAGYFKGVKSFKTTVGKDNTIRLQLMQKVLSGTLNAAAGGTINSNGGATIIFPAAAFVTSSGAAYSGSVYVYSRWIDPTAANLPFIIPGDLRGVGTNGAEYILESYGMVGAELEDASGNTLKIATGKKAAISFPLPTILQTSAPATIQLWHFDDASARWKENGTATKSGNLYSAQVDKFSFWNLDNGSQNNILINYTLINSGSNSPLVSTITRIKRTSNGTIAYGTTNNLGYVSGLVPKNEVLVLEVISNCGLTVFSQNIGPFSTNVSLGNVIVSLLASQTITFNGTLLNCSGSPVSNGYVSLYASGGYGSYFPANVSGTFSGTIINCLGTPLSFSYIGVDNSTTFQSPLLNVTATNGISNLGNVNACASINPSNVYVTTWEYTPNGHLIKVWKNGIGTVLSNGTTNALANSVFVSGNDVYVAGKDNFVGAPDDARIWKNGVPFNLNTVNTSAKANSIIISGADTYVAGDEMNSAGKWVAKIWKNGTAINLGDGTTSTHANSIFALGSDIYVAGQDFTAAGYRVAKIWKNGVGTNLTTGITYATASSVFVSGTDVYVAGEDRNNLAQFRVAKIWKNGISNVLSSATSDASAHSIYVVGSDVYVAGEEINGAGKSVAKFWKNGVATILSDGTVDATANSIFISNNNVYVAGSDGNNAKYWKNGLPINITTNATVYTAAIATSIFVN